MQSSIVITPDSMKKYEEIGTSLGGVSLPTGDLLTPIRLISPLMGGFSLQLEVSHL